MKPSREVEEGAQRVLHEQREALDTLYEELLRDKKLGTTMILIPPSGHEPYVIEFTDENLERFRKHSGDDALVGTLKQPVPAGWVRVFIGTPVAGECPLMLYKPSKPGEPVEFSIWARASKPGVPN